MRISVEASRSLSRGLIATWNITVIGTILDNRYRILKLLGAGGMGEVYLGEHLRLHRQEAIKILKSRFARDEGHLARFRREARATNRLQHNNIVSFYDFGKMPDGRLYLTMEFADGPNLKECLQKDGPFSASRTAAILRQLALAIHYAHFKGVIHRDLKPENLVLVQEMGQPDMVKVLDFGVAKITTGTHESIRITKEGQVFGTPAYIAPEQIRGIVDDPRSDIYAIGCIAYELLTGLPPFMGRPMVILEAHMDQIPPPPSERCEMSVPPELDEIILSCLVKDPADRFQTGAVVAEALSELRLESRSVRISQAMGETSISGFETDLTLKGEFLLLEEDEGRTTDVLQSRYDLQLRHVLRSLAEGLCDLGCSDPMLLVLLAEANQVEQELEGIARTLSELARSDEMVEQEARERSAALRFALGELNFGRDKDSEDTNPLADAVNTLTHRLENLSEETLVKHAAIMERQIDMTAHRAGKYEELREIDQNLIHKIDLHLANGVQDQHILDLQEDRARLVMMLEIEGRDHPDPTRH